MCLWAHFPLSSLASPSGGLTLSRLCVVSPHTRIALLLVEGRCGETPPPLTPNRILLLQVQEVLFQELCTLHGIFLTRIKNVSSKQEHGFPSPRDREA